MSTSSNDQGRAYEYAWIQSLLQTLSPIRHTEIVKNSSLEANTRAWNAMDEGMQTVLEASARAAVETILELEPRMAEQDEDVLKLEFQQDGAGVAGDVRDIVIKRDSIQWEVGLSVKHNHEAIKHSRLSHKLDFGKEWFDRPCSIAYWHAIGPVFATLAAEKIKGTNWCDLAHKEDKVYIPLLNAFMDEIRRAYAKDADLPQKMICYLVGTKDYYKVVSQDGKQMTLIHTFNIHETLNKPSKVKVSAITVPVVALPTELVTVKLKKDSKNTVEMYFNNGWQLSFRIHNASTKVEPSLKFDIQFIGMPVSILNIECRWK